MNGFLSFLPDTGKNDRNPTEFGLLVNHFSLGNGRGRPAEVGRPAHPSRRRNHRPMDDRAEPSNRSTDQADNRLRH